MRIALSIICLGSASAAFAQIQTVTFTQGLTETERKAVMTHLRFEPGFNPSALRIAKVRINNDDKNDLIVLFKPASQCAQSSCDVRVLLSHEGISGDVDGFQDAYAGQARRIGVGAPVGGVRPLVIDGKTLRWDGKAFTFR